MKKKTFTDYTTVGAAKNTIHDAKHKKQQFSSQHNWEGVVFCWYNFYLVLFAARCGALRERTWFLFFAAENVSVSQHYFCAVIYFLYIKFDFEILKYAWRLEREPLGVLIWRL